MRKTRLAKKGKSETAIIKRRIQALVREIVIVRDGGCILRNVDGITPCSSQETKDGHLVLQADHLVTRGKNVGFAETRLIICLCEGHHLAKTFKMKEEYEGYIRHLIGPERAKLWDDTKNDRKIYPMGAHEWGNVELALKQELKKLTI